MTFEQFIQRYALKFKLKNERGSDLSPEHVKYDVVVKSKLLPGKFKSEFSFNPNASEFDGETFLMCIQSDCRAPEEYSCEQFAECYGYESISEAIKTYNACVVASEKAKVFFGPIYDDLLNCTEYEEDEDGEY